MIIAWKKCIERVSVLEDLGDGTIGWSDKALLQVTFEQRHEGSEEFSHADIQEHARHAEIRASTKTPRQELALRVGKQSGWSRVTEINMGGEMKEAVGPR